jgi:hypothetical protein
MCGSCDGIPKITSRNVLIVSHTGPIPSSVEVEDQYTEIESHGVRNVGYIGERSGEPV